MVTGEFPSRPFTFVVTTIGRVEPLERLLKSLMPQLTPEDSVVVVAQDRIPSVEQLILKWRDRAEGRLIFGTSERGASRGRNAGARLARRGDRDELLMFPNDTSSFSDGTLDALRIALGSTIVGGMTVMTPSGARFTLPAPGTPLNKQTVWNVIEMGLVIRRSLFESLGGFDETLGTGAASPWQAGEVSDLLLRMLRHEPRLGQNFTWVPDSVAHVTGIAETSGLSRREKSWKLRAYGRGIGYVYRTHGYPLIVQMAFVAAGALIGIRRRGEYDITAGRWAVLGRAEGITGRTIGHAAAAAVSR